MAYVQIPLDVDGIDDIMYTQILKNPHNMLFHLLDLEYGRKPDTGTINKERGDIFKEWCTESFKANLLRYVNEVLFEMVTRALKDSYTGGTTNTEPQNEVSKFRNMYYDKETRVMVNQSVKKFCTQFLFKIDALPQDMVLPLDINETFFNNLIPDVREFLISERVWVPQRPPTETNNQVNQRIIL